MWEICRIGQNFRLHVPFICHTILPCARDLMYRKSEGNDLFL